MDSLPVAGFLALGFLGGFLCHGFFSHWFRLLLISLGKHPPQDPAPNASVRRGAMGFMLIHPVTWAIVLGLPWGLYRWAVHPPSLRWLSLAIAALIGLTLPATLGFVAVKRMIAREQARRFRHSGRSQ